MSKAHKVAFDRNAIIVKTRASKISRATNLLIFSIFSIFIMALIYFLYQNYERRSQMADKNENNSTQSSCSKPTMSSATTKPEVMLSTNSFIAQDSIKSNSMVKSTQSQKKSNNNNSKDK
jgi:hypothetical protein